jgi:hypothetical protein
MSLLAYEIPNHVHSLIFIIAIEALVFSIMLRSKKVILLQLLLFIAAFEIDGLLPNLLFSFFAIIQTLIGIFVIYKVKKAAERDYLLVLEKTHRVRPNLTKGNYWGL